MSFDVLDTLSPKCDRSYVATDDLCESEFLRIDTLAPSGIRVTVSDRENEGTFEGSWVSFGAT